MNLFFIKAILLKFGCAAEYNLAGFFLVAVFRSQETDVQKVQSQNYDIGNN